MRAMHLLLCEISERVALSVYSTQFRSIIVNRHLMLLDVMHVGTQEVFGSNAH